MKPYRWWERWPGRLEHELRLLDEAGIPYDRDDRAFAQGSVRLRVYPTVEGRRVNLDVVFPDLYPYFRFYVQAPDEDLPLHQHAQSKNLCLLGRRSDEWDTTDTVAGLLRDQLPRLFEAARSDDAAAVAGVEQAQAEPYGDYYPYVPAMLMVQGDWAIPPDVRSGFLSIGTLAQQPDDPKGPPLVRGVVLEVQDNARHPLARVDRPLRDAYAATTRTARWVRAKDPIAEFDPERFFQRVRGSDPGARNNPVHPFMGARLQIWGVLFPEQVGHRRMGEGWVFVCRLELEGKGPAAGSARQAKGKR